MPKKGQFKANAKERSVYQRKYNSQPAQKKRRAERNKARREMEKKGLAHKGDGKDVDHKNHDTTKGGNNLQMMSKSKNRSKNQWDKRGKASNKKKC